MRWPLITFFSVNIHVTQNKSQQKHIGTVGKEITAEAIEMSRCSSLFSSPEPKAHKVSL